MPQLSWKRLAAWSKADPASKVVSIRQPGGEDRHERVDPGRSHDHVDVGCRVRVGAQTGVHGRALDVQHVDAGVVGECLHGRVRELDPHGQGHVDDLGHGATLGSRFPGPPVEPGRPG